MEYGLIYAIVFLGILYISNQLTIKRYNQLDDATKLKVVDLSHQSRKGTIIVLAILIGLFIGITQLGINSLQWVLLYLFILFVFVRRLLFLRKLKENNVPESFRQFVLRSALIVFGIKIVLVTGLCLWVMPTDLQKVAHSADVYYEHKNYPKALELYTQLLKTDSLDAQVLNNRACCKHQLGDTEGACLDWQKAAVLGNDGAAENIGMFCK